MSAKQIPPSPLLQRGETRPVPASIAKLGICSVVDNLEPGQTFAPKAISRSFSMLFRDELARAVLRKYECAKSNSLPSR